MSDPTAPAPLTNDEETNLRFYAADPGPLDDEDSYHVHRLLPKAIAALDAARADRDTERCRREHTDQWYAERWARLRDLFDGTPLEARACNVMANGTADHEEPPTYAQLLNSARADRDRLAAERDALQHHIDLVTAAVEPYRTDCSTPAFIMARNAVAAAAKADADRDRLAAELAGLRAKAAPRLATYDELD